MNETSQILGKLLSLEGVEDRSRHNPMPKAKILIADEEPGSRRGLQELLASWGYDVAVAADGEEALEKASEFQPALIIADLVMPKMDGLALLHALKDDATP